MFLHLAWGRRSHLRRGSAALLRGMAGICEGQEES